MYVNLNIYIYILVYILAYYIYDDDKLVGVMLELVVVVVRSIWGEG